jgi:hypothetical protein
MKSAESIKVLTSLHDRGLLVPFIGSGMSMDTCVGWDSLISTLEKTAGITTPASNADLIARAEAVMQVLRRGTFNVPEVIREAVYAPGQRNTGTYSDALARMRWPLVCTTNYDDVYLRATMNQAKTAHRTAVPRARGRSEDDCRGVLQHLALPTGELLWCLQGFLNPEPFAVQFDKKKPQLQLRDCLEPGATDLSSEIVLSHSEYRSVTHRLPHFRRCFAEVFRSRSFLFLGSGLTETYFRSLFDEVVELVGPPSRPHFALVKKGRLDPEFMRSHYHTILIEYEADPAQGHSEVGQFLDRLSEAVEAQRVRAQTWGWNVPQANGPRTSVVDLDNMTPAFTIVHAQLPLQKNQLRAGDILGISCGRERQKGAPDKPMPGVATKEALKPELACEVAWHGHYLVSWAGSEAWLRGIVARDPEIANSREARSPEAVYTAFEQFLEDAQQSGKTRAFVQLLSAGYLKTFESWMSLVQMARAYGHWAKEQHAIGQLPLKVVVHLSRDDDAVALMNGGYLDIAEHLEDAPMRLFVEIIDTSGRVQRQHCLVEAGERLHDMSPFRGSSASPAIHALPIPRRGVQPVPFRDVSDATLSSLGLVSGSTLVADYRAASISAAETRALALVSPPESD